ncbi:FAD-binding domain-containing protein [uncultured Tateyamaria sp.]|uniref:FAD-binding domain-containing protein n=1 Tax=uncultured Tateyamaria sp. TaxID=455651 RepID=UPI00262FF3DC|nr:FAD-binding domain-containing protein [uncultured Tateyamaria sp.]
MTEALERFSPTRTAGLERLQAFVPQAGSKYAARRNYDLGRDGHRGVSTLSPYLRARLVTETEVLRAVLNRHSPNAAEKFIQEVYWRTYWKGWLEMRPGVWRQYQSEVAAAMNAVQTQSGLRQNWEAACRGETEIECFNTWAQELVQTGYLHNHARMWFASIWVFTLKLPWALGADFFLRHLLDGDPASNTLGWRWVAGIQTVGKTYLARPSNVERYTEGRFANITGLAPEAQPLSPPPTVERMAIPAMRPFDKKLRTGLIVHEKDLGIGHLLDQGIEPVATACIGTRDRLSPLAVAPHVPAFNKLAIEDTVQRFAPRLGDIADQPATPEDLMAWASEHQLEQIVTMYAPVGPTADVLAALSTGDALPLVQVRRPFDTEAWPHATHGFFRFKAQIPKLLERFG